MNHKAIKINAFLDDMDKKGVISRESVLTLERAIDLPVVSEAMNVKELSSMGSTNGYKEVFTILTGYVKENTGEKDFISLRNFNMVLMRTCSILSKIERDLTVVDKLMTEDIKSKLEDENITYRMGDNGPYSIMHEPFQRELMDFIVKSSPKSIKEAEETMYKNYLETYGSNSILTPILNLVISGDFSMLSEGSMKTLPAPIQLDTKTVLQGLFNSSKTIEAIKYYKECLSSLITNSKSIYWNESDANSEYYSNLYYRLCKFEQMYTEDNTYKDTMNLITTILR